MAGFVTKSRYKLLNQELDLAVDARDAALRERDDALRERDKAVRQRDLALRRVADRDRHARHMVFYHIPRTGGTSIWHALAACAESAGIPVVDLFHESHANYGSSDWLYNVLVEKQKALRNMSAVFHVHTPHNVSYFFEDDRLVYTTVVRDPIDRFVSDVCHLRKALRHMADGERQNLVRNARWQSHLAHEMLIGVAPIEAVLDMAAQEPFFRDYYYFHFYGLLCQKPNPWMVYQSPESPEAATALVGLVSEKFAYIGRFPDVAENFHRIADIFQLSHDCGAEFTYHINRLDSHLLVPDRHKRYGEAFSGSYELLLALGIEFPEREG